MGYFTYIDVVVLQTALATTKIALPNLLAGRLIASFCTGRSDFHNHHQ